MRWYWWLVPIGFAILILALAFDPRPRSAPALPATDAIAVIDGDTVRARGRVFRLVGFDSPETGSRARCEAENTRGLAATARLRELIAGGSTELEEIPCSCPRATIGTQACNYGRLCGVLWIDGRDVAEIMIAEGHARRYVCRSTSCPARQPWC